MNSNTTVMVSVYCLTYNQFNYVRQCLDGFVSQVTSFPFEVIVHDDKSTDGTSEVIQEYAERYPAIIKPIFEDENVYSIKGFRGINEIMISQLKGKYIAICEGDDYWIDSRKLQKQFDFMESNPDYMLCFHAINEIYEGRPELNKQRAIVENREYTGIEWYEKRPSQTSSYFFRREVYDSELYKEVLHNKSFLAADIPLLLTCAHYGKIRGMSEVMSVYRHNDGGWTSQHRSDEQQIEVVDSQLAYAIFGEDFKNSAEYFAQRDCIGAFLLGVKHGRFRWYFLKRSISYSVSGTIRAFYKIVTRRFD